MLPARVETVVIFVPDVWHLLPTRVEWESTVTAYRKELAERVACIGEAKKESSSAEELQALHHLSIILTPYTYIDQTETHIHIILLPFYTVFYASLVCVCRINSSNLQSSWRNRIFSFFVFLKDL